MNPYPPRPAHYDRKFLRLLADSRAFVEVGADGFLLLTVVVQTEDAARYAGPVGFWNTALMYATGIKSEDTLARVRQRCVDAGWLQYEPGSRSRQPRYFVSTPEGREPEPAAELPQICGTSSEHPQICGTSPEPTTADLRVLVRSMCGTYLPNPNPKDIPASAGDSVKAPPKQKKARTNPADDPLFTRFWAAYPKRVSKADAVKAFAKARAAGHITDTNFDAILTAVERQCRSPDWIKNGGQYVPYPASWLNARRWEDEPATGALPAEPPRIKRASDNPLVDDDYDYAPHGVTA